MDVNGSGGQSGPLDLNPNMILAIPASKVVGGKLARRDKISEDDTPNGDGGTRKDLEHKIHVVIPDVEERARAEAIVADHVHSVRKRATSTLIGYLADRSVLADINADTERIRAIADAHNAKAQHAKVEIGFFHLEIAVSIGPSAAKALADHVRSELAEMRDHLQAGRCIGASNPIRNILLPTRAGNLHALAVGTQADAIRFAIEEVREVARKIKARVKDLSETPESAARAECAETDGTSKLLMIDAAIETFTYAGDVAALPAGEAMGADQLMPDGQDPSEPIAEDPSADHGNDLASVAWN